MRINTLLRVSITSVITLLFLLIPVTASASTTEIQNNICGGADLSLESGGKCDSKSTKDSTNKINNLITQIVNIFSVIVGIVAVIMIVYGGFRYITSGGESGNVTNAKNTILYALIGLVIVALAQFIVKFVLAKIK